MSTNEQQIARAIQLAKENVKRGIIREPRVYFDKITMPSESTEVPAVYADPDVFRNGEEYPVRITHMTAAIVINEDEDEFSDERLIQRVGLRMMFHDHYYMQREYVRFPLWHNQRTAGAAPISYGQSSWRLHTPFIFSSRDSMDVRAQLCQTPPDSGSRDVSFGMTGIGLDSLRPYFKGDTLSLDTLNAPSPFNPEHLRNDGDEPILITDVTLHASADINATNPQGDVRAVEFSIRQVGNGTQAVWTNGTIGTDDLCPASLLGVTTGRAIVHKFPGHGILWEPGEGVKIELSNDESGWAIDPAEVAIAFIGTIEVR
jgi:hypothetical protein